MPELQRVNTDELLAGSPLPYPVFDRRGGLLFSEGVVIVSAGYLLLLLARGLYRDVREKPADRFAQRHDGRHSL